MNAIRKPPSLSTAPLEHVALDYAALRTAGVRHLERLAGHLWTDFNDHDPGITILEQLCYALTDVAYRAAHELPDLLSEPGPTNLYTPARILGSRPVTLLDLRKLVIDVDGVKNAWVEPVTAPPLYADLLHGRPPGEDAQQHTEAAVAGLRQAGTMDHLPRGLLTRAWLRHRLNNLPGAQAALAHRAIRRQHVQQRLAAADGGLVVVAPAHGREHAGHRDLCVGAAARDVGEVDDRAAGEFGRGVAGAWLRGKGVVYRA